MAANLPVRDGPAVPGSVRYPDSHQCVWDVRLLEGRRPARLARRTVHVLLEGSGVPTDRVFQIEEAVSELAANAESHGRSPWRLRVYVDEHSLWVGVSDSDFRTAGLVAGLLREGREPSGLMDEHGRGLYLAYQACRGECGVRGIQAESGKEVLLRFTVPLPVSPVPATRQ